jgi:hypothetical protein
MRRWIALAARIYPRDWRARYGDEFDALLEDARADGRQLVNVVQGAFAMQLTNGMAHLRVAGAMALAGAILAIAASFCVPPRYVASALVRIVPELDAGQPAAEDVVAREAENRIVELRKELVSRHSVAQLVQNPKLDLYRAERERTTLEDVMEQMADGGDIQLRPVDAPGSNGAAFRVSFSYPEKEKAHAALEELLATLDQRNADINLSSALDWERLWSQPIPFSESLDVIEPASLPASLVEPRREIFIAWGAAGGLALGLLAVMFRRHPGVSLRAAAFGMAGCAVAAGVSLLIPERQTFTAKAALRISAPFDPQHISGAVAAIPVREWVQRLSREVLSPERLQERLGPRKEVLQGLRPRDIDIHMQDSMNPAGSSFEIAYTDGDKVFARQVVLALVTFFMGQYSDDRSSMAGKHGAGEDLQVVDNGKVVTVAESATHNRLTVMLAGALLGILLGLLLSRGQSPHGPARRGYSRPISAVN